MTNSKPPIENCNHKDIYKKTNSQPYISQTARLISLYKNAQFLAIKTQSRSLLQSTSIPKISLPQNKMKNTGDSRRLMLVNLLQFAQIAKPKELESTKLETRRKEKTGGALKYRMKCRK